VARQQADRAHDAELVLRQQQQRRAGWLEANAHLGPTYRQVVRELAWQRRARGLACEAVDQDRPGYLREALGPVPESTRGKRAWRQAAAQVSEYRTVYGVSDPERALGPAPRDPAQRADWQRAQAAIQRVHHKQRITERAHDPESLRMAATRQQQPAARARLGRDAPGRRGPERAAG
jgi:hypothetical protein